MATVNKTALLLAAWLAAAGPALADPPALDGGVAGELTRLAGDAARIGLGAAAPRVEVELGKLDASLTLAPCQKVEPYLLPGMKPWGRTRIGLRCLQGATRWNVFLPMTVKVFARSLVAATALPAGTVLQDNHLIEQEVDIAASPDAAIARPALALGRALARPLAAGEALRGNDLKARQWFAAGDIVRVVAVGPGYAVSIDAEAISPGIEGKTARVRTDSGRIISGIPSGERRMEISL